MAEAQAPLMFSRFILEMVLQQPTYNLLTSGLLLRWYKYKGPTLPLLGLKIQMPLCIEA